jgi:septation ring formation regulator EzrA
LFNLDEEINNKYKNAILINDELADIKLTLTQLLGLKLQFANVDQKSLETIKNIIEHIKVLQNQLSEKYFQNYDNVNDELIKIREQTGLLISSAAYNQTLKVYAQRLIYYINKYRNEHEEINRSLNIAEDLYRRGQYQTTIDQMIETVTIILSSAKESKIIIN